MLTGWSVGQEAAEGKETPERDDVHQLVNRTLDFSTISQDRSVSQEAAEGKETPERDDVHQLVNRTLDFSTRSVQQASLTEGQET
ncbi:hypothetical protein ACOMHN_054728 [Nucella lapillus]